MPYRLPKTPFSTLLANYLNSIKYTTRQYRRRTFLASGVPSAGAISRHSKSDRSSAAP